MRLMILFWLLAATAFYGINGADFSDCSFQEFLTGTQTKNLVKLEQPCYRFVGGKKIYVNDEPLFFWLQQNDQGALPSLTLSSAGAAQQTVKISIEPFGSQSCLKSVDVVNGNGIPVVLDLPACAPQPSAGCKPLEKDGKKYVPFKAWTENGPGEIRTSDNVYVFQEEKDKKSTTECGKKEIFPAHYGGLDYTSLKPIPTPPAPGPFSTANGKDYIKLTNPANVVWLKLKDSLSEYFLLIETATGQMMEKTVKIGLEANGLDPHPQKQPLPNGFKIKIQNKACIPNYAFLGYVRYVITVNEPGLLKASFSDVQSGGNLKLYYLQEEADGKPKAPADVASITQIDLPFTTTTTPATNTAATNALADGTSTTLAASTDSLPADPVTKVTTQSSPNNATETATSFLQNGEMVPIGVILFFVCLWAFFIIMLCLYMCGCSCI